MRIWKALLAVSLVFAVPSPLRAQQFGEKQEVATSIGRIGLTVTNIGVIGNSYRGPFVFGVPSCEYPIGSGIEHLFDGGLWVGSVVRGQPWSRPAPPATMPTATIRERGGTSSRA